MIQHQSALIVARVPEIMACYCTLIEAQVVGYNTAAFSSGHVFVHLKAEGGHVPERAHLLAVNTGPICLGTILQQKQLVEACELCYRGDIDRCTTHVHGNNAAGSQREISRQFLGINSECFINIRQYRNRTQVDYCSYDCDPHISRHDDFLSGANSKGGESGVKSAGAAAYGNGISHPNV